MPKRVRNDLVRPVICCTLVLILSSCATNSGPSHRDLLKTAPAMVECLVPPQSHESYTAGFSQSYPESVILTTLSGCLYNDGKVLTSAEAEQKRAELAEKAETESRNYVPTPPSARDGVPLGRRPNGTTTAPPLELVSRGTGFVISKQGHVLTNYHVVEDCIEVRVRSDVVRVGGKLPARNTAPAAAVAAVLAGDARNDVALLKLEGVFSAFAIFRSGKPIRPGNDVMVIGFPLPGLLASEANVTKGSVSARAGLGDDTRLLQITAPVQSGNSGGPVLDMSGRLVGIVVSKLDAISVALVTGEIPQNINFAIKASIVRSFLDSYDAPVTARPSLVKIDAAEIVEHATRYTLPLECWS